MRNIIQLHFNVDSNDLVNTEDRMTRKELSKYAHELKTVTESNRT